MGTQITTTTKIMKTTKITKNDTYLSFFVIFVNLVTRPWAVSASHT
jgi:hypothetical protein